MHILFLKGIKGSIIRLRSIASHVKKSEKQNSSASVEAMTPLHKTIFGQLWGQLIIHSESHVAYLILSYSVNGELTITCMYMINSYIV